MKKEKFYGVYEKSNWIINFTWDRCKNLSDIVSIKKELIKTVENSSLEEQKSLLCAHPLLAGKLALNDQLTNESKNEQNSAGLNKCSQEELNEITKLNKLYFNKFNFPFIVSVSGMNVKEILIIFNKRLDNNFETEFKTAIEQVHKIADIRIKKLKDQGII